MLNKKAVALCSILFFLMLVSCKSKELANNKNDANLIPKNNIVENKSYNEDNTMLLVTSYQDDLNPRRIIDYKVVASKSKKTLKAGIFTGMKLEWFTKNQLKGYLFVGMIEKQSGKVLQNDEKSKNIEIIDIK
jgi:hypothetical protein